MTTSSENGGTLRDWLDDLARRGCRLTVTGRVIHVRGRAANDDHDHTQVARHHHALEVAAAGDHAGWWNTVLGRTAIRPDVELPTADGDEWACACCGDPSPHVDHRLLPWCHLHWRPDVEEPAA